MATRIVVATDNFPGVSLSPNYNVEGGWNVGGNVCTAFTSENHAFRNSESYSPDQFSEIVVVAVDPGLPLYVGTSCRVSGTIAGSDFDAYAYETAGDAATNDLSSYIAGLQTTLQTYPDSPVNGDTLSMEVIGDTITIFINGVPSGTPQVDLSIATGTPGFNGDSGSLANAVFGDLMYDVPSIVQMVFQPSVWWRPHRDARIVPRVIKTDDVNPPRTFGGCCDCAKRKKVARPFAYARVGR